MRKEFMDELEARVQAIILRQLQEDMRHVKEITLETPILGNGLGLDSLEALALVTRIEAEFGIFVDDEELNVDLFENIGTLAKYVGIKLSRNHSER
jgi:acyl carrier protein